MHKIAIVILNWNGLSLLKQFLPVVIQHSQIPEAKIYIADNGSTDESVTYIKEQTTVELIQLDKNYGFTGGYNKALQQIDADYFLLLNSDVAPCKNWLPPLLKSMEINPEAAICVPKIKSYRAPEYFEYAGAAGGYIDKYGFPFCKGRIFNHLEKDNGQYDISADIMWASGAALMIRSNLFLESGGFDEDFFAHMEEIDLCWRLKNQGWKIKYVHNSEVNHLGGATLDYTNPIKTKLNFRNNLFLITKNITKGKLFSKLIQRLMLDGIAAFKFLASCEFRNFNSVLKAHCNFYGLFPKMYKKRKALLKKQTIKDHNEIYQKSIVFQFFIKKNKTFSSLENPPTN